MAGSEAARLPSTLSELGERVWRALTGAWAFRVFAIALVLYEALGVALLDSWGGFDFWEHLAAIEAFARDPVHPVDPYIAGAPSSHLFTPYHLLWGLVTAITNTSAFTLAPLIAAVNASMFVVALRLFAKRLTGSASFALPLGLAMLFLWLRPFGWSGFHHFGMLPLGAIYPFWFALSLAMITLGVIDEARPARARGLVARVAMVALVFLVHPLTGSFLALALSIRALAEPALAPVERLARGAAVIAGVLLSLAWPHFPVLAAIASAPRFARQGFAGDWKVFYEQWPVRILPAALGLLWFAGAWRRRSPDWLSWLLLASAVLYLANPFTLRSAFLSRYLIYLVLVLQWGAVRWLADASVARRATRVALFLAILTPMAALQFRVALPWVGAPWIQPPHGAAGAGDNRAYVRRFRAFAPHLTSRDVVMAGPEESWILPVVADCRVVGVLHGNPFLDDFEDRRRAMDRFFHPSVTAAERSALLERYGVTRVLVPRRDASRLEGVEPLPVVFADDVYELRTVPAGPAVD